MVIKRTADLLKHKNQYENQAKQYLQDLSSAVYEVPKLQKMLAIIWTAGPVTVFGLIGGHWLAYETLPSMEILLYFGSFTLITGLISIFTSILGRAKEKQFTKHTETRFLNVVHYTLELYVTLRNIYLDSQGPEEKIFKSALMILEDPDASEESVRAALSDLIENKSFVDDLVKMEIYRRKNLNPRVQQLQESFSKQYQDELSRLQDEQPYLYSVIQNRIRFRSFTKKLGRERKQNFINRYHMGRRNNNLERIELEDTIELVRLIVELLLGRSFLVYRWKACGKSQVIEKIKKFDRLQMKYNQLKNDRLKIVQRLYRPYSRKLGERELDEIFNENLRVFNVKRAEEWLKELPKKKTRRVKDLIKDYKTISRKIKASKAEMLNSKKEFRETFKNYSHFDFPLLKEKSQRTGFYLAGDRTTLHVGQLNRLVSELSSIYEEVSLNDNYTEIYQDKKLKSGVDYSNRLDLKGIRILSMRMYTAIHSKLRFDEACNRDSVERSMGLNLAFIDLSTSRKVQLGWLQALIDEIHPRPPIVAYQAFERLLSHLDCERSEQSIQFFKEEFRIDIDEFEKDRQLVTFSL